MKGIRAVLTLLLAARASAAPLDCHFDAAFDEIQEVHTACFLSDAPDAKPCPHPTAREVEAVFKKVLAASGLKGTAYSFEAGGDKACAGGVAAVEEGAAPRLRVCAGMLREARSPDEIAALLGHLLGHLVLGHPKLREDMAAETVKTWERFMPSEDKALPREEVLARDAPRLCRRIEAFWSRLEGQADRQGMRLAAKAGYKPGKEAPRIWWEDLARSPRERKLVGERMTIEERMAKEARKDREEARRMEKMAKELGVAEQLPP